MHTLGRMFGGLFEGLLAVFGWLGVAGSLTAISLMLGVIMLLAFKWVGDPNALGLSTKRMLAHMMEMRLFDKEPRLVFLSMARLLRWNGYFFVATLRPAIIATVPMILLFVQMEGYYGMRALEPGEDAVVIAKIDPKLRDQLRLEARGEGVSVETESVRSRDTLSWRVRAEREGVSQLVLTGFEGDAEVLKSIHVGGGPQQVSMRRGSQAQDLLLHPSEAPIERAGVDWIELHYPTTEVRMFGLDAHWLWWLVFFSVLGVLPIRSLVNAVRPETL